MQIKILPYSGERYTVSEEADVFDKNGEPIEIIEKDGKRYVELEWVLGKKYYEKALVVLSAFDKIGHSAEVYDRMEIIYIDGNTSNCFPSNLLYVFDTPLESRLPGYFLIPSNENYAISQDGELRNIITGKTKTWSIQHGESLGTRLPGYRYTILYRNTVNVTHYLHRLLCLVFKKFVGVFSSLTVNHKDGDKTNNALENLEWVTYSENLKHAWDNKLRHQRRQHVLMRNLLTGKVTSFKSIRECGRYLGDSNGFYVSDRITIKDKRIHPDYLDFKMDDGEPWPELDLSIGETITLQTNDFVARNVFTGEITIFSDPKMSEELFDIPSSIVLGHSRNNKLLPYKGYNFRFLAASSVWPKHTARHLEVYKVSPTYPRDAIVMIDNLSNEESFFPTMKDCEKEMNVARAHLQTMLSTDQRLRKRYSFRYFKLKENLL